MGPGHDANDLAGYVAPGRECCGAALPSDAKRSLPRREVKSFFDLPVLRGRHLHEKRMGGGL